MILLECPYCLKLDSSVIDSRLSPDKSIRRRRECNKCKKRFTTYERIELVEFSVVKKNNSSELFDRNKLLKGILKACEKRPIKREQIELLVSNIESNVRQSGRSEIKSKKIGELVMAGLKTLDEVAYIRFASVYKKFRKAGQFVKVIEKLKTEVE